MLTPLKYFFFTFHLPLCSEQLEPFAILECRHRFAFLYLNSVTSVLERKFEE